MIGLQVPVSSDRPKDIGLDPFSAIPVPRAGAELFALRREAIQDEMSRSGRFLFTRGQF